MTVKKTIRRRNALARFTVMSIDDFEKQNGHLANYGAYLARKDIEHQSLLSKG